MSSNPTLLRFYQEQWQKLENPSIYAQKLNRANNGFSNDFNCFPQQNYWSMLNCGFSNNNFGQSVAAAEKPKRKFSKIAGSTRPAGRPGECCRPSKTETKTKNKKNQDQNSSTTNSTTDSTSFMNGNSDGIIVYQLQPMDNLDFIKMTEFNSAAGDNSTSTCYLYPTSITTTNGTSNDAAGHPDFNNYFSSGNSKGQNQNCQNDDQSTDTIPAEPEPLKQPPWRSY